MPPTNESNKNSFPYKTLIWMLFAGFAIFIFKDELKLVISDAEELSVFGVNVKTSKKKANELEFKINEYQQDIATLTSHLSEQQVRADSLVQIKNDLLKDLKNCPGTKESTALFDIKFEKLSNKNIEIETESKKLKNMTIIKRMDNLQLKSQ